MARVVFGQGVSFITGKVGGSVFQHGSTGSVLKNWSKPANRRTISQVRSRAAQAVVAAFWTNMSSSDKSSWTSYAASHPVSDAIAGQRLITGQNWFFKHARQLISWGVPESVWTPVRSAGFNHPWVQAWLDDITAGGWSATYADTQVLNRLLYKLAGIGALDNRTIIFPMAGNAGEPFRWPVYNRGSALAPGTLYNMGSSAYYPRGVSRGVYFDGQTSHMRIPNSAADPGFPVAVHLIGVLSYPVAADSCPFGTYFATRSFYLKFAANAASSFYVTGGNLLATGPSPQFASAFTVLGLSSSRRELWYDYSPVAQSAVSFTPNMPTIYIDLGCIHSSGNPVQFCPFRMKSFSMFSAPSISRVQQVTALLKECDDGLTGPLE
jgi:hypothetical protein